MTDKAAIPDAWSPLGKPRGTRDPELNLDARAQAFLDRIATLSADLAAHGRCAPASAFPTLLFPRRKRGPSMPLTTRASTGTNPTVNKQFPSKFDASRRGVSLDHVERLLDRTTLLNMPDPRND